MFCIPGQPFARPIRGNCTALVKTETYFSYYLFKIRFHWVILCIVWQLLFHWLNEWIPKVPCWIVGKILHHPILPSHTTDIASSKLIPPRARRKKTKLNDYDQTLIWYKNIKDNFENFTGHINMFIMTLSFI